MDHQLPHLPPELLARIYELLPARINKIRFRSVCRAWRNSTPAPPINPNSQLWNTLIPMLNGLDQIHLLLAECVVYYLKSTAEPWKKGTIVKIYDPWNGWNLQALHPFDFYTRMSPPMIINMSHFRAYELGKSYILRMLGPNGLFNMPQNVVTSLKDTSNGVQFNNKFQFMGIMHNQLVRYKFGDNGGWSVLENDARCTGRYKDIVYRRDKFYILDDHGNLRMVDSSLNSDVVGFGDWVGNKRLFLVESRGELYLVALCTQHGIFFTVYRFSDANRAWCRVKDLGGCAFFLEEFSSFSVAVTADFPQLRRNRICFGLQVGTYVVYNMGTNSVRWLYWNHPRKDNPFLWPPQ